MLSRRYRFHSRGGVHYTYKHGRMFRGAKISLIANENSRKKQRFAVVISKKILKSAVGRNRIRRRVYEAIRLEFPRIKKPIDCIFLIYSKDILTVEFKELRKILQDLLKQADIIE